MKTLENIKITAIKTVVNTLGQWSDGIKLASTEGFTSGEMLDYIYKNKAQGKNLVGKMIDKIYLNHRGWQVVRIRKDNLAKNIRQAVWKTLSKQNDVFICDIASGPAKYILEVLEDFKNRNVYAQIRDIDERWLKKAKITANEKSLKLDYKVADALNPKDFVFDKKSPDIMVASGFYDWFNDEEVLKKSMTLIYNALSENGYFVFSVQTGHVDLEMTNAVFKDFNNKPLAMAIWSDEKIAEILKEIGFKVVDKKSDKYDNYQVYLAQK